jgi:hypothetical protein
MDAVADQTTPVFFGGVNVWLQQHSALFRWLPRWLDRAPMAIPSVFLDA